MEIEFIEELSEWKHIVCSVKAELCLFSLNIYIVHALPKQLCGILVMTHVQNTQKLTELKKK